MTTLIVLPVNGPSPNVNSGLASASSPGTGPFTNESNTDNAGTGPGPTGLAGTTIDDRTCVVNPSTRTAYGYDSMSPSVESELPAGQYPPNSEATVMGSPQGTTGSGTAGVTASSTANVPTNESV